MTREAGGAMRNTGLRFGVLGPLLVTVNGTRMPLGAPKQRAVLAMLVINRNRPVSVDSLINAVWDEEPVPAARTSIQSHVSNLRRLLRTAGVDPHQVLASAPPGYQLSVADADCDLGRFITEKAAGVQAAAAGRFEDASSHLSAALREWRGPVLDDLREFSFVDAFATALVEDKVAVHTALAEAEIACGRPGAVIGELEALTAEHPYHEPLWAQLITAYYVTERQSDALRAYRRLKTGLAEGLGIDPGPTVSALHERILRQEPLGTKRADLITHKRNIYRPEDADPEIPVPESVARLRDKIGRQYRLNGATTRIGRLDDNDIVLDDNDVSRHHAVITDTGTGFVITDLRSTNGVEVHGRRIRGSATLDDGDRIRIGSQEFTFEIRLG
jgi:DNA-binding SARP family transcriptional activator